MTRLRVILIAGLLGFAMPAVAQDDGTEVDAPEIEEQLVPADEGDDAVEMPEIEEQAAPAVEEPSAVDGADNANALANEAPAEAAAQVEQPVAQEAAAPVVDANAGTVLDAGTLLAEHNRYRARHCSPPMTWSDNLAAAAQAWANRCEFAHDPNAGAGENINWGGDNATGVVASWYDEVAQYDFANPGFKSGTGHFTQVVWKGSTQLGCGMAMGCQGFAPGQAVWICRYGPAGNMQGDFPANVTAACQ